MKQAKLTEEQAKLLKDLLLDGYFTREVAEYFSISESSVYNYRRKFEAEGIEFPNHKGQNPRKRKLLKNDYELPESRVNRNVPLDFFFGQGLALELQAILPEVFPLKHLKVYYPSHATSITHAKAEFHDDTVTITLH